MWLLWLIACAHRDLDSDVDTDVPEDTDPVEQIVVTSAADAVVIGEKGAMGSAIVVGDVTGDGAEDLVVGGIAGNRACVVPGPISGEVDLTTAACAVGEASGDYAGWSLALAGDADGDGVGDVLIGAPGSDVAGFDAGRVYLVRGPIAAGSLSAAWASFDGEASLDGAGTGLTGLGDMDGDGDVDLLIGAPANDVGGAGAGRAYLIRGPIAAGAHSLADADARIQGAGSGLRHAGGEGGDAVGWSATGGGDLDGDGLPDAVISAGGNDASGADHGLVAVFLGPVPTGNLGLGAADRRIVGELPGAFLGEPVRQAGDLDGDGLADLFVGTSTATDGRVYVLTDWAAGDDAIAEIASTVLLGAGDDGIGGATAAGDLDGDGIPDVAVGALYDGLGGARSGAVYAVPGPLPGGVLDVREAATLRYAGAAGETAGSAVAIGDLGGGIGTDLAVGAPLAAGGAGGVYLFYGGDW